MATISSSPQWGTNPRRISERHGGLFGDSFFNDCFEIVSKNTERKMRSHHTTTPIFKKSSIVSENVTSDVPEEDVKPWYRKTNLSRMSDDDIYQVMLEVSSFNPSDLHVRLVNDDIIIVEGKHGERADSIGSGYVSREFTRKYQLPPNVKPESIECFLSSDGVLVVRGQAPKRKHQILNKDIDDNGNVDVINVLTNGYLYKEDKLESPEEHTERIIPISREELSSEPEVQIREASVSLASNSGRNSRQSDVREEERSKSSTKHWPKVDHPETDNEVLRTERCRTVSVGDDDETISSSPIIEEASGVCHSRSTSPMPPRMEIFAKKSTPILKRQDHFSESEEHSFGRADSIFKESQHNHEFSANEKSPGIEHGKEQNVKKPKSPTSSVSSDHQYHKITRAELPRTKSPSYFGRMDEFDDIFERHRHLTRDLLDRGEPLSKKGNKPLDTELMDLDAIMKEPLGKLHDKLLQRHRHLSKESEKRWMNDLQDFRSRSRSPLILGANDHLDVYDFDKYFPKKQEVSFVEDLKKFKDFEDLPTRSRGRQYEKQESKGYDEHGRWTERFEERIVSHHYASSDDLLLGNRIGNKNDSLGERSFKISTAA